jgi:hypothetical protein
VVLDDVVCRVYNAVLLFSHEPHLKPRVNPGAPEVKAVPEQLVGLIKEEADLVRKHRSYQGSVGVIKEAPELSRKSRLYTITSIILLRRLLDNSGASLITPAPP